jgi:hypothetical protein
MLDEALEILTAAWSAELWTTVVSALDGRRRAVPAPARSAAWVPVSAGGYPGKRRPLRRAARYQGFFPVDLEHPDQLAEIVAELASVRGVIRDGPAPSG